MCVLYLGQHLKVRAEPVVLNIWLRRRRLSSIWLTMSADFKFYVNFCEFIDVKYRVEYLLW